MVRGFQFAMEELPESSDPHYAGKGVKQGAANTPIFWYKPEGQQQYRIIDANLSVRTSDTPPQVANSQRLWKEKKALKAK